MPVIEDNAEYQVIETVTANGRTLEVRAKPGSTLARRQSIEDKAQAALTANATYLGLATPSAAQTTAQVQRLTRECNALIRLLLGRLEEDDA